MRFLLLILIALIVNSCSDQQPASNGPIDVFSKITFVELGSVKCVPCQRMQPVMKSLEERYGNEQLEVRFIDIFKDREAAEPFDIKVMPTQVFLDEKGDEFHRHVGFYPEEEIDSLLQAHGLEPIN